MELRVLGPVELWVAGAQHALGSHRERSVLAVLLLSYGRAVSIDTLVSRVWDGRPPPKARQNLHSYTSRLRSQLRKAVGTAASITYGSDAYSFVGPRDALDLDRFRSLCRQARAIAPSGDPQRAATLFRQAEALWSGPALAGLPGDWMRRLRDTLDEERRSARIQRINIELELGRHSDLLGELYELVAGYPLDERLTGALMLAAYRSDRQADALTAYHQIREALREQHGTEPGQPLQRIYQRILERDIELAVTPRHRRPGHRAQPNTLPPDVEPFIGRPDELAALMVPVAAGRRLTVAITGMPGVGKTALATHAVHRLAARYPDAQLFLDLAAHSLLRSPVEPANAIAVLLGELGISSGRIPRSLDERMAMWQAEMASRRAILFFDDAADVEQVLPLLPRSPSCLVLVTSRNRLRGLTECEQMPLGVLPDEDAASLLVRSSGVDLTHDHETVRAVVGRYGHLPLALRMAARQVREFAEPDRYGALEDLTGTLPPYAPEDEEGQVNAAFALSYSKLPEEHRHVLRRLCLHPCRELTLYAATALTGRVADDLRPILADLADRHLLDPAGDGLYQLHDLVRDFADERMAREEPPAQRRAAVGRLLGYYLAVAGDADRLLFPHRGGPAVSARVPLIDRPTLHDAGEARAWMESEWRNALKVAEYAAAHERKEQATCLAYVLAPFLDANGSWIEAIGIHETALRACRETGDLEGIARASAALGFARFRTGHYELALRCAAEALEIHRRLGDMAAQARIHDHIGVVHWSSGRSREALAHYREALEMYRAVADRNGEAAVLAHSGLACFYLGRHTEAVGNLQESLRLYRGMDDRWGAAKTLNNLADVYRRRGYHRDAIELYQASSAIFRQVPGRQYQTILRNNMGNVRRYKGNYAEALALHRKALREFRETGDRKNTADALNCIGDTYCLMDKYSEALVHYEQARLIATEISDSYEKARALRGIAESMGGSGRYQEALGEYEKGLAVARDIGDIYQEAKIYEGMGNIASLAYGPHAARIHWRQALDLFETIGVSEAEYVRIKLDADGHPGL